MKRRSTRSPIVLALGLVLLGASSGPAATAFLEANRVARNPHGIGVFAGGSVRRGGSGFNTTM